MASPKGQPVGPKGQTASTKGQTASTKGRTASTKGQTASGKKKKIFLSGPMNSTSDINGQVAISSVLKPRFNVYLAPVDGVEILTLIDLLANPKVALPAVPPRRSAGPADRMGA